MPVRKQNSTAYVYVVLSLFLWTLILKLVLFFLSVFLRQLCTAPQRTSSQKILLELNITVSFQIEWIDFFLFLQNEITLKTWTDARYFFLSLMMVKYRVRFNHHDHDDHHQNTLVNLGMIIILYFDIMMAIPKNLTVLLARLGRLQLGLTLPAPFSFSFSNTLSLFP